MYTLVVVDMQERFTASTDTRTRKNVLREITQAVQDDAHIIFLEFNGCGPTLPELVEKLHTKCVFKTKLTDDGSAEVESEVILNKLPKHFKVVGVNTDCCVHATVRGLTARFAMANIDVIADACNSDWHHGTGIQRMIEMKGNVKVKFAKEEAHV